MFSKETIEKLAWNNRPAPILDSLVATRLFEVRSEALKVDVPVSVLVAGNDSTTPVVFMHLDGGIGDRESLVNRKSVIAAMVETRLLPKSIHISFSGGSNVFYTNEWETWVIKELPQWANEHLNVDVKANNLLITGISGGGHGALKMAFKYPDRFKAVAAMEPVMMPTLTWPEQHKRASWWMLEMSARAVWGEPFPESFIANQPANLAIAEAERIRASGLDVYLEVGDEDMLHLQDGAEFLHRILWKYDIPHEFHQVRWADHGGKSIDDRFIEAMAFLAASHAGGKKQSRNLELSKSEQSFVDYVLGGGPIKGEPPPENASQGTIESELSVMSKLWEPLRTLAEDSDPDMKRHYGRLPNVV